MRSIDVGAFLEQLSPDRPCGEDLEYDPAFGELERAAQGKPEQQFGDTVVPAEAPDWPTVRRLAVDLSSRTRDLRVAVHLTRGATQTDGFPGLRDGLEVVCGFLERFWDDLHPHLDAEDDNDPTVRVNTLATLCDPDTMLRLVRSARLVEARGIGRFGLRDYQLAEGTLIGGADEEVPDQATIEAAFLDCDLDELESTADAVQRSLELLDLIESAVADHVQPGYGVDLGPLKSVIRAASVVLAERLSRRGVSARGEGGPTGDGTGSAGDGAGGETGAAGPAISGEIRSREDVIRFIDKACDYYAANEPSSPVPMLLQRAKRLARKSFIEIIRDMAPEGIQQVESIGGVADEDSA